MRACVCDMFRPHARRTTHLPGCADAKPPLRSGGAAKVTLCAPPPLPVPTTTPTPAALLTLFTTVPIICA